MIGHVDSSAGRDNVVYRPGTVFAGFTIGRVLGTGGMGTVYLVQSPRLDRVDALKVLTHDLSTDAGFRARFEQEARLASRLAHPNIVRVYDRDSTDGQLWIHMEYVDGIDCSQALRAGPLDPRRALHVIDKVASALDFAHRRGLLHRDVKPANVLLAPGDQPSDPEQVFLTDFGVAKAEGEDTLLTTVGVRLYTPDYAAPEQILGRTTDRRIDIYSLGCVLYELLTGEVPFPLRYREATLEAHVHADRPRPSARVPSLPAAVDYVVARAMAVNPADRYATCSAFARAAQAALFPPQPHHRTQPLPLPLRQNTTVAVRPHGIEPPIRDRPTRSDSGRPAPRRRARRIASRAVTALVVAATTAAALTLPADSYLSAASGALDLPRSAALPDEAMVAVLEVAGNVDLYLVDTVTRAIVRRLTSSPDADRGPSISPDRQSIIYVRDNGGPRRLRVMAANGADDRELFAQPMVDCTTVSRPAWNLADASILAIVCFDGETQRSLRIIRTSGEVVRTLDVGDAYPFEPAFSPDGSTIAFWSGESADASNGAIYSISVDGSAPIRLSAPEATGDSGPMYSPDGREIAFRRRIEDGTEGGNGEIFLMNADGSEPRVLAPHVAQDAAPAWSTDGTQIAFMSRRLGPDSSQPNHLWVVQVDGQDAWQAVSQESGGVGHAPAWGRR